MTKMTSAWMRLLTVASLLYHQSTAHAEPVTEQLFFKDETPAESRRTVQAGEDVVLECEAAGRPSPTIYWQHTALRHNPVLCSSTSHSLLNLLYIVITCYDHEFKPVASDRRCDLAL